MRRSITWVALAAALLLVGVVGFAIGRTTGDGESAWGPRMMGSGPGMMTGPGWRGGRGFMALDEEDFLNEMVAHHEEAIEAAGELARSDRPAMQAFGADIVRVQSAQVEQMQGWLDRWYGGPSDVDYRPMMRDLSELEGDDLDEAFLVDMIRHHRMAVMMAQHALVRGDLHEEVEELARDIRDEQSAEIAMMARWLQRWFGGYGGMMWMHRG